jgi:HEAT repeat protein
VQRGFRVIAPGVNRAVRSGALAGVLASMVASGAAANGAKTRAVAAVAPPGTGQPALAVGFDEQGTLRAAVCAQRACTPAGGEKIEMPADARALAQRARLNVVGIGAGRRAIVVVIPDTGRRLEWQAVIVAPPTGTTPKVVFQGWTGFVEGQDGERRGPMVSISEPEAGSGRRIVIGEQREDLALCGRPAVLAPKLLSPDDLELRPAKVQRLDARERENARRVVARRLPDDAAAAGPLLLRAFAATSAVGRPEALTDGNPETTWSENRGGSGRGEFVLMHAPPELPLRGFELRVRPAKAAVEQGRAPREFWLATSSQLVHVTLPEDAWRTPGARYEVTLDRPLQGDCLALVAESAFDEGKDVRVTFAELTARSEFDATALDGLVGALAGGGERAVAAGSVLRALGAPAFAAVSAAFAKLDEGGRRVALEVIDGAPCKTSVRVYLRALLGPHRAQRIHARDRIRRCGPEAADQVLAAMGKAKPGAVLVLANELALIAPERAVGAVVARLDTPNVVMRRELRIALARAASTRRAAPAVREALSSVRSEVAGVDLLRALGPALTAFMPEAGVAFGRLATPQASFRTRYLLLEPASELEQRDHGARAFLRRSLALDPSPHVRARAASMVARADTFRDELLRAAEDKEVRVRHAVVETFGERRADFAAQSLGRRLASDDWPLVRAAAADALGALRKDPSIDKTLGQALGDDSQHVRAEVIGALGARGAGSFAPQIRERLEDDEETASVRAAAAGALGRLCDTASVELLTGYAKKLNDPLLDPELRPIAALSLEALAHIHPPDLAERLAPLRTAGATPLARRAAEAALREPGSCGRSAPIRR